MNAKLLYQMNRCSQLCKPSSLVPPKRQFLSVLEDIFGSESDMSNENGNSLTFVWAEKITQQATTKRRLKIASRLAAGSCDLAVINELCKIYNKSLLIILGYFHIQLNKNAQDGHIVKYDNGKYLRVDGDVSKATIPLTDKGKLYADSVYRTKDIVGIMPNLHIGNSNAKHTKKDTLLAVRDRLSITQNAHSFLFFEN